MADRTTGTSQEATILLTRRALTRRSTLAGGAAFAAGAWMRPALAAAGPDPFHDATHSVVHPRSTLMGGLSASARQAQETSRLINGIQVTGLPDAVPEFDAKIVGIMAGSGIPGVSLALARNGALVLTRGYGRANIFSKMPVEPTMPATIMSVSKPITVMAALCLVRDGKLRLNDLAFQLLRDGPLPGATQPLDMRQYKIEVRHLMSHTSGLFNVVETLNDPPRFQALARGGAIRLIHGRIGQNDLVRAGMSKPLLFNPGDKSAYSGQGMQVLARIIERISGLRLDRYIQRGIFDPLGIRSYFVGSYLADQQYGELVQPERGNLYAMTPAVFDKERNVHRPLQVNRGEYVSWGQADACGWGSLSSLDLLRFVSAVPSLVGPELWRQITERPLVTKDGGQRAPGPFGLGWGVADKDGRKGISHGGGWPGARSFAALRPDGSSLAVLVNSDDDARANQITAAAGELLTRFDTLRLQSPGWRDYGFT